MIKKNFIFFVIFTILSSCGFKVVNNNLQNFNIVSIDSSGETRINYLIKNNLLNNNRNSNRGINLKLLTSKKRIIKEKNIKNEITKYQIIINADIEYALVENNIIGKFALSKEGVYDVNTQYSRTINNEKNLIIELSEDIASEIINNLVNINNDL